MLATIRNLTQKKKKECKNYSGNHGVTGGVQKLRHKGVHSSTGDYDGGCNVLEPVKNRKQEKKKKKEKKQEDLAADQSMNQLSYSLVKKTAFPEKSQVT